MFVTVSTGIGSGLILGGRLHEAPNGQDVGLGFARGLQDRPLEHGSSGRGLEGVAAAGAFPDVPALFDAAEAGDPGTQASLQPALLALAWCLADAQCLLGLDILCLGGRVGLRTYTQGFLRARLQDPGGPTVQVARYGGAAGLIGTAQYAVQQGVT